MSDKTFTTTQAWEIGAAVQRLNNAAVNYAREVEEMWGDSDEYLNSLAEAAVDFGKLVGWEPKFDHGDLEEE